MTSDRFRSTSVSKADLKIISDKTINLVSIEKKGKKTPEKEIRNQRFTSKNRSKYSSQKTLCSGTAQLWQSVLSPLVSILYKAPSK